MDYVDEARGAYVGSVDRQDAIRAIEAHTTGPVIIDFPERGFAGGSTIRTLGYAQAIGAAIVFTEHPPIALSKGVAYRDAFVLDLSFQGWTADRYVGGLDLHFGKGVAVRLVFWNSFEHETDSGDTAPGFGSFRGTIDDE